MTFEKVNLPEGGGVGPKEDREKKKEKPGEVESGGDVDTQNLIRAQEIVQQIEENIQLRENDLHDRQEKIAALRQEMGAGEGDNAPLLNEEKRLAKLREQQLELRRNTDSLERLALGCPVVFEKGQGKAIKADPLDPKKTMEDLLASADKVAEQQALSEAELKQERKKMVEEFAKDSVDRILKYFEPHIEGCENKEKVKKIMPLKLMVFLAKQAKRFIEEGGKPDYGFQVDLRLVEHDSGEGKKKFISEINIIPYQAEKSEKGHPGEEDDDQQKELLGKDDVAEIKTAKEQGNLKEEKIGGDKEGKK